MKLIADRAISLHEVRFMRKAQFAFAAVLLAALPPGGPLRAGESHTLVFFGDSLTAGYGLDDPLQEAYPALIQQRVDSEPLPWKVVNAGLSGDTTAAGLRRVDWVLRQPVDLFVLALGGNDGLRGITPEVTGANLRAIIVRVRTRYPSATVLLAGMRMPPNMGEDYTRRFASLYPAVANDEHVGLIPFLLEGVGGRPEYNQTDGIHPNAAGHVLIARALWPILRPYLAPATIRPK
jgi:acyl-CoA thioesterase-1